MNNRKLALVTGAGGGIGAAAGKRFLREGYGVILVDRDKAALRAKFGDVSPGGGVVQIVADLEDETRLAEIRTAVDGAEQGLSAAAFCHGGCVVDSTPFPDVKFWEQNYRGNVIASVHAFNACAESLKRGKGTVILLSSVDAILSLEGAGPYDAAKAAQLSLAKGISRAYAPEICAIAVALGTVRTDVWKATLEINPGILDQMGNENLAGKVLTPDEVAGLVWLLCQEEARIVRGQTVIADNGWSFLAGTFRFDQRKSPKQAWRSPPIERPS